MKLNKGIIAAAAVMLTMVLGAIGIQSGFLEINKDVLYIFPDNIMCIAAEGVIIDIMLFIAYVIIFLTKEFLKTCVNKLKK